MAVGVGGKRWAAEGQAVTMSSSCSKQPTIAATAAAQRGIGYRMRKECMGTAARSARRSGLGIRSSEFGDGISGETSRDQAARGVARWASIMVLARSE